MSRCYGGGPLGHAKEPWLYSVGNRGSRKGFKHNMSCYFLFLFCVHLFVCFFNSLNFLNELLKMTFQWVKYCVIIVNILIYTKSTKNAFKLPEVPQPWGNICQHSAEHVSECTLTISMSSLILLYKLINNMLRQVFHVNKAYVNILRMTEFSILWRQCKLFTQSLLIKKKKKLL